MDRTYTPDKTGLEEIMNSSNFNTPMPQASSTVNRRVNDSLPAHPAPVQTNVKNEAEMSSPALLLNAIDGLRNMSDQLREKTGNAFKLPVPGGQQIRRAVSVAELYDDRRGSVAGDSEANSSLGILKLDECQGFSESEDAAANLADLLANYRKEYPSYTLAGKENCEFDQFSSKMSSSRRSLSGMDSSNKGRQPGIDISSRILNTETESQESLSMQADLRLRFQKALAQRTIDRSIDSVRLSQLSDYFEGGNLSVGDNLENDSIGNNKDFIGADFSKSDQTSSPSSSGFVAANFMSFSGSPAMLDSSENFQSADKAKDRMEKDENSWRQHFEDLPVSHGAPDIDTDGIDHLTQNLDFSTMSGIIGGDVTVSSSIMEDVGKRRLSPGEYFKLHSAQLSLGSKADDESSNYLNSLKSPSKRRPHPPLVHMDSSNVSVDEIPTRDSGLNKTLNFSFPDTLNFSVSMKSDVSNNESAFKSEGNPASRSMDLMPPPPAPPRTRRPPSTSGSRVSEMRDSVSTRLSMSLSLPRDFDESGLKDLNSSSLSLDSGEKFVSISQMVKIMQDLPSGQLSTRQLLDDFMLRCKVSHPEPKSQSLEEIRKPTGASCNDSYIPSGEATKPKSQVEKSSLMDSLEESPSNNQRVKEWISAMNNSGSDSVLDHGLDYVGNKRQEMTTSGTRHRAGGSLTPQRSRHSDQQKSAHDIKVSQGRGHQFSEGRRRKSSDHDASMALSFMPPPPKAGNPSLKQLGNFSTPKFNGRQTGVAPPDHRRAASASVSLTHQRAASQISHKTNLSQKLVDLEGQGSLQNLRFSRSRLSQDSDHKSIKFPCSSDKTSDSKSSSQSSSSTLKSLDQRSSSRRSDSESRTLSEWKESRPASKCGSSRSAVSCAKSSSKQTDVGSVASGPLQIDSTHTQLSWASVSPGSSVTQTFALRNKASARVRLLVSSPNAAFKLIGERGEVLSELLLTLHLEETRRIHVIFSPISTGSVVGKLVICRSATSESGSVAAEDRRLIGLYGYGGMAELSVEGASKDRWAQLFLNMCISESDAHCEISDIDLSNDAPQVVSSFSVRNIGKIPAFLSLLIAGELPFDDCGVYLAPKEMSLMPGEVGRVVVRFDPGRDILQWLHKNADDMQLLGNIWLSWSELATWQRLRRLYLKYYKDANGEKSGPLSTWGNLYTGELGVGHELKDNRSSESVLAQAVRRLKVAVLVEREKLNMFDMDATMVFDTLVANETAMFNSPLFNERTLESSEYFESPILSGPGIDVYSQMGAEASPLSTQSKQTFNNHADCSPPNDLVIITTISFPEPQAFSLEFPPTTLRHKSKIKITFQNPSSERSLVSIFDLSPPFSVSTPKFIVPAESYVNMSVLFRPIQSGTHHRTLNVLVDGNLIRSYLLRGEGVQE